MFGKLIFVTIALLLGSVSAAAAGLATQLSGVEGWASWSVAMIDGVGPPCCLSQRRAGRSPGSCDLDARSSTWNSSSDDARSQGGSLSIYAHVTNGRVDRLRTYAADCPVVSALPPRALDSVSAADTVSWLREHAVAKSGSHKDLADSAISTMAFVADAAATQVLADLVDSDSGEDVREAALFWLAQNRGATGAAVVERFARSKADPELRAHALFALSQSGLADAYQRVRGIGAQDASEHVRTQALFWMAQMDDVRAREDILTALARETTEDGQEHAVFALSQLEHGAADPALIAVVRGKYPRTVKERALFWLGQSGSDQALAFFDEVLGSENTAGH